MEIIVRLRIEPFELNIKKIEVLNFLALIGISDPSRTYLVPTALIVNRGTVGLHLLFPVLLSFAHCSEVSVAVFCVRAVR